MPLSACSLFVAPDVEDIEAFRSLMTTPPSPFQSSNPNPLAGLEEAIMEAAAVEMMVEESDGSQWPGVSGAVIVAANAVIAFVAVDAAFRRAKHSLKCANGP